MVFGMWRKGEVVEGGAGRLVRMAEGQAVTYKLTKKLTDLADIEELPERVRTALGQAIPWKANEAQISDQDEAHQPGVDIQPIRSSELPTLRTRPLRLTREERNDD